MLVTYLQPLYPTIPPTTVPTNAPTTGTGIKAWPMKAPTIEEPMVAPAFIANPVSYDNFLVFVLNRLENIL